MVQLNEWTGGTMCGATMQMWALQGRKLGHAHCSHGGNATGFLNEMQSASLRKCRVSFCTFGLQGKLSTLPEHGGEKHQKGKRIPFLVLLWILGGEEAGPLQRPDHFSCRGLDSPLTHSKVIMDPVTYNPKKLRKNTLSSSSPPPLISFPFI